MNLWDTFSGTTEADIIAEVDAIYTEIEQNQASWKRVTPAPCPDGCGKCCVNFEPDITEVEALYTAAWLLQNKPEWAEAICSGTFVPPRSYDQAGCILFNPNDDKHCTIYNGRMEICRLFGFCGDTGKDGNTRWRPCRFLTDEYLASAPVSAEHRQYTETELRDSYGEVPPVMDTLSRRLLALNPGGASQRYLVRDILPSAIRRLKMIIRFKSLSSEDPDDPSNPNGTDNGISA